MNPADGDQTQEASAVEVQQLAAMNSADSNQPLSSWLSTRIRSWKGKVFLVVSVLSAGSNLFVALNLGSLCSTAHMPILYGTQAVILLIICAIIAFGRNPNAFPQDYNRGSRVVRQFWKWWPPLWFAWFILYAGLAITEVFAPTPSVISQLLSDSKSTNEPCVTSQHPESPEPIVKFGLDQLNNVATLILLMLFHVLARPSVPKTEYSQTEGNIFPNEQSRDKVSETKIEKIEAGEAKFWFWVALFFVSAILELALVSASKDAETVLLLFGIFYGIIGATVTALVVGKLDDNLLGVPTVVIVVLFFYAGIQPSFRFLITPSTNSWIVAARELIVVIALISKILLFATIQWLSTTNRLLYYMVQSYTLYERVDANRQKFLQDLSRISLEHATKKLDETVAP